MEGEAVGVAVVGVRGGGIKTATIIKVLMSINKMVYKWVTCFYFVQRTCYRFYTRVTEKHISLFFSNMLGK